MGQYKLSEAAKDDLAYLYEYGIIHFGLEQANDYYDGLTERFDFLSDNPGVGFHVSDLSPGLQRFPFKRHAVFYKATGDDVLIVRVLGDDMDFERQFS